MSGNAIFLNPAVGFNPGRVTAETTDPTPGPDPADSTALEAFALSSSPAQTRGTEWEAAARRFGGAPSVLAQARRILGGEPSCDFRWPTVLEVNGGVIRQPDVDILETVYRLSPPERSITLREILGYYQWFPEGFHLSHFSIQSRERGGFHISLVLRDRERSQSSHSYMVYPWRLDDFDRVHDLTADMGIREEGRGRGLGAVLAVQWLLLLRRLGIQQLQVTAGEMGIYFWPSRGFDFGSEALRREVLENFRLFLQHRALPNGLELRKEHWSAVERIRHAWELAFFTLEWGELRVPAGRQYLQNPSYNKPVEVQFDLHDDYEGWKYLRRGLAKHGMAHLLPDFLGPDSPAGCSSFFNQSAADTEK